MARDDDPPNQQAHDVEGERAKLRALASSLADEVWVCDADGRATLLQAGSASERRSADPDVSDGLAGPDAGLEVRTRDGKPRGPDEAPLVRSLRGEVLKDVEEVCRQVVTGETRFRLVSSAPLRLHDGTICGALAVVRDITARRHVEAALRAAGELLGLKPGEPGGSPGQETTGVRDEAGIGRLAESLRRRAEVLAALDRASRLLTSSLDPELVLRLVMVEAQRLVGTEGAFLLDQDAGRDDLLFVAAEGVAEPVLGNRVAAGAGLLERLLGDRQAAWINDLQADPRAADCLQLLAGVPVRSMLAVPVVSRWAVRGLLGVVNKSAGELTDDDAQVLSAIGNVAAVALDNAWLYAAEQERRKQLEAVRSVAAEITRELDLSALLRLIAERAAELVGTQTATVWLWDEETECLVPQGGLGHEAWIRAGRLKLGEGVAGVAAERREGLVVNDYRAWTQALPPALEQTQITAVLAEPLVYRHQLLGAIAVDNEETGRSFTEEDRKLLALFATHIAIALANAKLFGEVRASQERLQSLSRRLVEVQEGERRHLARELHDEIGQALTGLKLILGMGPGGPGLTDAQALIGDLLARVRELSLELRPAMLDDLGLLPALVWYFERYRARTGVQVVLKHAGLEGRRFDADVETAAYRIVQEALTNVARHAGAREATVRLYAQGDCLGAQIEDRGKGFDVDAVFPARASGGLSGMRERAELLGGRLTVESSPGAGTLVAVEFPLPAPTNGKVTEA